jgi:predicted nucleic acid-binding protein
VAWYLDTSAFLKLLVQEPETTALREWFAAHEPLWSSQLLRTEALKAAGRLEIDDTTVERALAAISLVLPAVSTFFTAGRLDPPELRSLDALHLAAALELGDDLEGVVTYDGRMIVGATTAQIPVVSPGA